MAFLTAITLIYLSLVFIYGTTQIDSQTPEGIVLVVTGGARGIGRAIVEEFLANNAKLAIILDVNLNTSIETKKELDVKYGANKVVIQQLDVTNGDDLNNVYDRIFKEYDVDLLVNNAGVVDEVNWKQTLQINLQSVIESSYKYIEKNRKDRSGKGGHIINISSISGFRTLYPLPVYTATKHGVLGFSKCIGNQQIYNKTAVRVITICPGSTQTAISKRNDVSIQLFKVIENKWKTKQSAKVVAEAVLETFKGAATGTAWVIEGGRMWELPELVEAYPLS